MKTLLTIALVFGTAASFASTDIDSVASMLNKTLGKVTVCDSVRAVNGGSGYEIAEHTFEDGSKKVVKAVQNIWDDFEKKDDHYEFLFKSIRWNKVTKTTYNDQLVVKLEASLIGETDPVTREPLLQLNLYKPDDLIKPVAQHTISISDDGVISMSQTSAEMVLINGKALAVPYVIKASKVDGLTHYTIDEELYEFSPEIQEKIEHKTGRKFFKENNRGEEFTSGELKEIATEFNVKPVINNDVKWQTCSPITDEEMGEFLKRG